MQERMQERMQARNKELAAKSSHTHTHTPKNKGKKRRDAIWDIQPLLNL